MADEGATTTAEDPGALTRSATRSLRRARKLYEGNGGQQASDAIFYLQEAQTFALMDLAKALRETRGQSS